MIDDDNEVNLAYDQVIAYCRAPNFKYIFDDMLRALFNTNRCNFRGGRGDFKRTIHENLFLLLYPNIREQVHFGTGPGGYEKYGFKSVTVDFYDEQRKLAIEIDGSSHKDKLRHYKDKIKEGMLYLEHGIRTARFTNQEIEEMLIKILQDRHSLNYKLFKETFNV